MKKVFSLYHRPNQVKNLCVNGCTRMVVQSALIISDVYYHSRRKLRRKTAIDDIAVKPITQFPVSLAEEVSEFICVLQIFWSHLSMRKTYIMV
ncbi:hypothetical protein WA026_018599 [Henosepilachna vigintioctopunctata]|uniref:Uncharacterized protein n=1 Tax=Henosepilachna vigintioctopunctata TaxID=420089 RepID=A0AAW1UA53_9CUCU